MSSSKSGTKNFESEVSGALDKFIHEIHIALYGGAPMDEVRRAGPPGESDVRGGRRPTS